eukprot:9216496-Pyramimonas_sp.AAC.1
MSSNTYVAFLGRLTGTRFCFSRACARSASSVGEADDGGAGLIRIRFLPVHSSGKTSYAVDRCHHPEVLTTRLPGSC